MAREKGVVPECGVVSSELGGILRERGLVRNFQTNGCDVIPDDPLENKLVFALIGSESSLSAYVQHNGINQRKLTMPNVGEAERVKESLNDLVHGTIANLIEAVKILG